MDRAYLPLVLVSYVAIAWTVLRVPNSAWRARLFAAVNVAAVFSVWYATVAGGAALFAGYLGVVVLHYAITRWCATAAGVLSSVALLVPIAFLVVAKTATAPAVMAASLVGISYMTFRLAHLVVEVRNGRVPMPSLAQHVGFAFFAPTMAVGPISPYSMYAASVARPGRGAATAWPAMLRIVVGAAKLMFLAHLAHKLSYDGLLLDGHPHGALDYVVAGAAYYLYVYCNFSGFCDMMIGAGGLLGIQVAENFANPLGARNVQEFWSRWHMTLSTWMRDVVFTPVSKVLVHRAGPAMRDHAIGATVFVVFVLVGLWHGFGRYYLLFGVLHAAGVTVNYYAALRAKRRRARTPTARSADMRWTRWLSIAATQAYVGVTFYFFWLAGRP